MATRAIGFVLVFFCSISARGAEGDQASLAQRVPFLEQRLHSTRWEVRYYLLHELVGKDAETKRALETLTRDKHQGVANQAIVRYITDFVNVDKRLFDPKVYLGGRFPVADLPAAEPNRALVDYCLGRRKIVPKDGFHEGITKPILAVLNPEKMNDPDMYASLTIVGILGQPEDAPLLHPFLESTNDYVVVGAAKALFRLGDKEKALDALVRLTNKDPKANLYYVTEALYVLREIEHHQYRDLVLRVLSNIERTEGIQLNWLNGFFFLAVEVKDDVWK